MHFIYGKIPQKFHAPAGFFSIKFQPFLLVLAEGEVTLATGGGHTLYYNGAGGLFGDVYHILGL